MTPPFDAKKLVDLIERRTEKGAVIKARLIPFPKARKSRFTIILLYETQPPQKQPPQ